MPTTRKVISSYEHGFFPCGPVLHMRARGSGNHSGLFRKRRDDPAYVRSPRIPIKTVYHTSYDLQNWHTKLVLVVSCRNFHHLINDSDRFQYFGFMKPRLGSLQNGIDPTTSGLKIQFTSNDSNGCSANFDLRL
jgi:hypothetical protein